MSNITITPIQARKAHKNADVKGKQLLEDLIGKEVFENTDIRYLVKTLEDAYSITKRPKLDCSHLPVDLVEYFEAQHDAIVIAEALNEGWTPDWDNSDELKWYPWFVMGSSAFTFYSSLCDCSRATAGSGSRLRFKTEELATYAGKQFLDVFEKLQLK